MTQGIHPLSGASFALASVPLIKMLTGALGGGRTFAHADDIGIVLRSLGELRSVYATFAAYEAATCLALNIDKCALIPLRTDGLDEAANADRYAAALRQVAPAWAHMPIRPAAKYLGAKIGPATSLRDRWEAPPLATFNERLRQLTQSHLAPSLVARLYAT